MHNKIVHTGCIEISPIFFFYENINMHIKFLSITSIEGLETSSIRDSRIEFRFGTDLLENSKPQLSNLGNGQT